MKRPYWLMCLINGKFYAGWEQYEGKPQFGFFRDFYDQPLWSLHIGPFWIVYSLWGPA